MLQGDDPSLLFSMVLIRNNLVLDLRKFICATITQGTEILPQCKIYEARQRKVTFSGVGRSGTPVSPQASISSSAPTSLDAQTYDTLVHEDIEEEDVEEEKDPHKKRKGVPPKAPQTILTDYFAPTLTPRSRPRIKSAVMTEKQKDEADMAVGRWWFDSGIPFKAARSKFYQPMVNAIGSIAPGYKMPSYYDLRGKILRNLVEEVDFLMEEYKLSWSKTGCSIMAESWMDGEQKSLMNFLVYCGRGVLFLKSVDTSAIRKNADALLEIFDEVVSLVGPRNVVQFITDNDAIYEAAGKKLTTKYGTFYWTPCAAHCIDLIFEDMASPNLFPKNAETIETAKKVTRFIYNHAYVLNLMKRDYTNGRDLVRPASTKSATNSISLQCLYKFRNELRQMCTSTAWVESIYSSTPIGLDIVDILLSNSFWKDVEHILKVSESLVTILRLLDSEDKPAMGYLYEALNRAKEVIQSSVDKQRREITKGFNAVVERLIPDEDIQDIIFKQCDDYEYSKYEFGTALAIRNRYDWWDQFGCDTPELQNLAIRVLSQCCSISGCERNLSIFGHIHSPKRNRLEHQIEVAEKNGICPYTNQHARYGRRNGGDCSPFNPDIVLRGSADGGGTYARGERGSFELYYDDGAGSGLRPLLPSMSEILMGSRFDRLLDQLSQIEINGVRRCEHRPASKAAVELMPTVEIAIGHVTAESHCTVCMEQFELGSEAREMPCKHIYHPN
ncbi:hypothetical protein CKAN_02484700 [Cinnamomum micranthum f. kanehirae]|uniref:DUF659 domain-containing protein n=1 Tax=Cinnamomum micranthum f. kanehirae TaxID=337451 RepID=A0A3S3NNB5_9MAGN|nr:hypothetical protein CKAN_02484700 [Cinnamomum micranthum f. kanehirae]